MRAHPSAGVHISGTTKLFSPGHDFPSLLSLMQNINASHAVVRHVAGRCERRALIPDAVTGRPARSGGFPPASVLSVRITDKERLHWRINTDYLNKWVNG